MSVNVKNAGNSQVAKVAMTRRIAVTAVFTALACDALSFGFRVYVDHIGDVTMLYGSIATIALLLIWMYLISYILLAGGFMNRVVADRFQ